MVNYRDFIEEVEPYEFIGGLIPVRKQTLCFGASGVGKSISLIKFLNQNNIEPILVDFDNNPEIAGVIRERVNGHKLIDRFMHSEASKEVLFEMYDGKVFIIDTWFLYNECVNNINSKLDSITYTPIELLNWFNEIGITVIVIAHNKPNKASGDLPDMENTAYNHMHGRMRFEAQYHKTGNRKNEYVYTMFMEKWRGGVGDRVRVDWMRD